MKVLIEFRATELTIQLSQKPLMLILGPAKIDLLSGKKKEEN